MLRPKEYLVSIKELPPGSERARGRLSKAHDELCRKAAASGVEILGYTVTAKAEVTKAAPSSDKTPVHPLIRFPEETWKAVQEDGKVRSMREACRGCGMSLTGHHCDNPTIVSLDGTESIPVTIMWKGKA